MIDLDVIRWLTSQLRHAEELSEYSVEYATALLMNLSIRPAGLPPPSFRDPALFVCPPLATLSWLSFTSRNVQQTFWGSLVRSLCHWVEGREGDVRGRGGEGAAGAQ